MENYLEKAIGDLHKIKTILNDDAEFNQVLENLKAMHPKNPYLKILSQHTNFIAEIMEEFSNILD